MNKLKFLILFAVALLAGCETMTVSECKVADWGRVGFADGARGDSDNRIAAHTESCAQAGVKPNAQAYRQGWDAGIQRFCTPANGWREGLQGNSGKTAVCRGQQGYDAFLRYLDAGLQVNRTQGQLGQNDGKLKRLQKQLEESNNDDQKRRFHEEMRHIDREQYRLRNLLRQQEMLAP